MFSSLQMKGKARPVLKHVPKRFTSGMEREKSREMCLAEPSSESVLYGAKVFTPTTYEMHFYQELTFHIKRIIWDSAIPSPASRLPLLKCFHLSGTARACPAELIVSIKLLVLQH